MTEQALITLLRQLELNDNPKPYQLKIERVHNPFGREWVSNTTWRVEPWKTVKEKLK